LHTLHEMIVKKSFQYSQVIQCTPNKHVQTRAQSAIVKLNLHIGLACWIYVQYYKALVKLHADPQTLMTFQNLIKKDIKASTAILDPNEPGSSSLRLS